MATNERDYSHRSLLDKLGVKPECSVAVRNVTDEAFLVQLRACVTPSATLRGTYDLIFLQIDSVRDLAAIAAAVPHLVANGGLWIFHPKGRGASPHESEVRAAGIAAGLVDNKVCAINTTHTATRFVIPKARR